MSGSAPPLPGRGGSNDERPRSTPSATSCWTRSWAVPLPKDTRALEVGVRAYRRDERLHPGRWRSRHLPPSCATFGQMLFSMLQELDQREGRPS